MKNNPVWLCLFLPILSSSAGCTRLNPSQTDQSNQTEETSSRNNDHQVFLDENTSSNRVSNPAADLEKPTEQNESLPQQETESPALAKEERKESPLPESRRVLSVPQSVQENGYYCGPASLQMVLAFHGIEISQDQLASELHTSSVTGTEYVDAARVANKYLFGNESENPPAAGYHVQTITIGDSSDETYQRFLERAKESIDQSFPVFCAADVKELYPELFHGNHLVIITGYETLSSTDEIGCFYIQDPSYLVQDPTYKGLKTIPAQELFRAIYKNVEPAYIWAKS